MLYLVGLGLKDGDLSVKGKQIIEEADEVYIEKYTSLPFDLHIGRLITELPRERVESEYLVERAKQKKVVLLVFGDPLFATTHISLIQDCISNKVPFEVVHAPSIINAIGELGISTYNFGYVVSIPYAQENYAPTSFLEKIEFNYKHGLHTLMLPDPKWKFKELLEFLRNFSVIDFEKLLVIKYADMLLAYRANEIKELSTPISLVLLGKLNKIEEEFLNNYLAYSKTFTKI
jgi:diphthine synthase